MGSRHASSEDPADFVDCRSTDGKIPALTADGERRAAALAEQRAAHPADGPEDRALSERCILWPDRRAAHDAGPLQQQLSDPANARIRRHRGRNDSRRAHHSAGWPSAFAVATCASGWAIRAAIGKATRWWSTPPISRTRRASAAASENLHLIERFTRTDADTILYEFTVDDPGDLYQAVDGANDPVQIAGPIYEYACHEGNYGMVGILRGARAEEKQAAK